MAASRICAASARAWFRLSAYDLLQFRRPTSYCAFSLRVEEDRAVHPSFARPLQNGTGDELPLDRPRVGEFEYPSRRVYRRECSKSRGRETTCGLMELPGCVRRARLAHSIFERFNIGWPIFALGIVRIADLPVPMRVL